MTTTRPSVPESITQARYLEVLKTICELLGMEGENRIDMDRIRRIELCPDGYHVEVYPQERRFDLDTGAILVSRVSVPIEDYIGVDGVTAQLKHW